MATTAVAKQGGKEQRQQEKHAATTQGGIKGKLAALKLKLESNAVGRVAVSVFEGFQKDEVPSQAAAMTYYGVFSLFPLLLLFMSLAGLALQSNQAAREQILAVIVGLLPQGQDDLQKVIRGVIDAKGAAAGIGILFLLWSALGWFQVIDKNINRVWGVSKDRSFIKGKLFGLMMVAGVGGVALLSFVATAAVHLIEDRTGGIPGSVVFWQLVVGALTILTIAGVFFVLYRYAPQRKVQFADVWPAALITAVVFELTRRLLTLYIQRTDMVSGYGPIGAAMLLLFWIYVVSIIILLGAELTYSIAKERRHIEPEEEMQVIGDPGEQPSPKFAPQVASGAQTEAAAQARGPVTLDPTQPAGKAAARIAEPAAPVNVVSAPPRGAGGYVVRGMATLVGAAVGLALIARRQMNGRA